MYWNSRLLCSLFCFNYYTSHSYGFLCDDIFLMLHTLIEAFRVNLCNQRIHSPIESFALGYDFLLRGLNFTPHGSVGACRYYSDYHAENPDYDDGRSADIRYLHCRIHWSASAFHSFSASSQS